MAAIASRWFRRKASQRLAGSESLGARLIQREMVLSERSKPSMRSSPCILGAPQVGLSATIRKISSRTSLGVGLLPTSLRTLEISLQYIRKPVRCQRTTVSGVTMMRDSFQADQPRPNPSVRQQQPAHTVRILVCCRHEALPEPLG